MFRGQIDVILIKYYLHVLQWINGKSSNILIAIPQDIDKYQLCLFLGSWRYARFYQSTKEATA